MSDLTYTLNEDQLATIKNRLAKLDYNQEQGAIQKMLIAASILAETKLKENVSNVILKVRTGLLRNSLQSRVEKINGQWQALIGSGVRTGGRVPYADILESGGTITPKKKQFLAIPLPEALTPAGVPKFTPMELKQGQAGGYSGSVIIGGVIFGITDFKTRTKITPLFALKKSVTIPAKLYLSKTLEEVRPEILSKMTEALDKAVNE